MSSPLAQINQYVIGFSLSLEIRIMQPNILVQIPKQYLTLVNEYNHRCAIPARINQYQYLILKNQVSIPISISIFQISEIDTDFNTNTPDLENQYRYQYQYLSFENSITIPIPILKIL